MVKWIQHSAFIALTALSLNAQAYLPLAGSAEAYWLGWIKLYDAKLYTQAKQADLLTENTPVTLELCYQRSISRDQIIAAANKALPQNLSPVLQQAVTTMHSHFQNVHPGDCYRLSYQPKQGTSLFFNDNPVVTIYTPGFKRLYFGIWLGKHALSTTVRQQLLAKL